MLKRNIEILATFLSKVISKIFKTGVYPDLLKIPNKVTPIYKTGDKNFLATIDLSRY